MSAETVATVGALIHANRELLPVLEEHLADNNGEVLPTIVLDDVVRWLVAHRTSHPEVCRSVFAWLEEELTDASDRPPCPTFCTRRRYLRWLTSKGRSGRCFRIWATGLTMPARKAPVCGCRRPSG